MRQCNNRMASYISAFFDCNKLRCHDLKLNYGYKTGIEYSNVYQNFIRIDLKNRNSFRVPLFILNSDALFAALSDRKCDEAVFPVNYSDSEKYPVCRYKSAETIMRCFSDRDLGSPVLLQCIRTVSGIRYYGAKGIMMNSNRDPLLFPVCECSFTGGILHVDNVITYIHPKVFLSSDMLEKCIISTIIPRLLHTGISIWFAARWKDLSYQDTPYAFNIVIKDIRDEFFYSTKIKGDHIPDQNEISEFLIKRINCFDNCKCWL